MDISARAFSLTDRPQRAIRVTSVRMRRKDRSSISTYPLADLGWKLLIGLRHRLLLISPSSFVRAKGRSFVPARRTSIASRAGAVKAGPRAWLAAGSGVARLRLGRAAHGARIKRVGRLNRRSSSARRRVFSQHRPGDAGKLVGERDREHVVVQPPFGGFDPGFEPITFPVL